MSSAPPPPRASRRKKTVRTVRAIYAYTAQQADELTFPEGALLYVLRDDGDWWECRCGHQQGLVPSNYLGESTETVDNPIHEAAKRGNLEMVEEMLEVGISVNGLDRAGNTPLHWAARSGHLPVVQRLLAEKPIVDAQNKLGDTPLHAAAWGGHSDCVQALLSYGVNRSLRNTEGMLAYDLSKNDQVGSLLTYLSVASLNESEDPDSD